MTERRALLEQFGRYYAEQGLAVVFTVGISGEDAKAVTTSGWQTTRPLRDPEYAAGLLATRGLRRNPAITARTSNLILIDCDTQKGLSEIEALRLPPTWTVRSSADWKRHYYFRPPAEAEQVPKVGFRFEEGGFKGDASRYLVCPPAIHPLTSQPYRFLPGLGPGEVEIAELPLAVYRTLCRRAEKEEQRARAEPLAAGLKIREGNRRAAIFRYACMLRRWETDAAAIEAECQRWNEAHCEPVVARLLVVRQVEGAMRKAGEQELRKFGDA